MLLQGILDNYFCGERHTDDQVVEDAVAVAVVVSGDQSVQHDDRVGEDVAVVIEMARSLSTLTYINLESPRIDLSSPMPQGTPRQDTPAFTPFPIVEPHRLLSNGEIDEGATFPDEEPGAESSAHHVCKPKIITIQEDMTGEFPIIGICKCAPF